VLGPRPVRQSPTALHVADNLGNVGFDVLVPDPPRKRFLLVEVKRVGSLEDEAAFFLSEDERR